MYAYSKHAVEASTVQRNAQREGISRLHEASEASSMDSETKIVPKAKFGYQAM